MCGAERLPRVAVSVDGAGSVGSGELWVHQALRAVAGLPVANGAHFRSAGHAQ